MSEAIPLDGSSIEGALTRGQPTSTEVQTAMLCCACLEPIPWREGQGRSQGGGGWGARPPPLTVVGSPWVTGPRAPTTAYAMRGEGLQEPTSAEA